MAQQNRLDEFRQNQPALADMIEEKPREEDPIHEKIHNEPESEASSSQGRKSSSRDQDFLIEDDNRTELVRIATALSQRRSSVAVPTYSRHALSGIEEYDETLDPQKPKFNLSKWLRRFIDQLREQGIASRSTGVFFRDVNVYGSGSALRLQSTVGSVLMAPLRLRELLRMGSGPKKHILKGFDGNIREGEMLIVLGRPGSGCSTFLKTLCSELHGLKLGEQSNINYNGIPQKQMQKEFKGEAIYNEEASHFSRPQKPYLMPRTG